VRTVPHPNLKIRRSDRPAPEFQKSDGSAVFPFVPKFQKSDGSTVSRSRERSKNQKRRPVPPFAQNSKIRRFDRAIHPKFQESDSSTVSGSSKFQKSDGSTVTDRD
jgi:hypothetical protein